MSRITDNNRLPEIAEVIKELNKYQLQVGIFAPEGSELFMIAMVNEYGIAIEVTDKMRAYLHYNGLHLKATTTHINIPERSFIRAGYDSIKSDVQKLVRGLLPRVLHLEMSPKDFYGVIGQYVEGQLHQFIASITEPPNHPYTVQGKGSSKPLINQGRLNQAITYRVVKRE